MEDGNCILTGTTAWEGQPQHEAAASSHTVYKLGTVQPRPARGSAAPASQLTVHGDTEGVADSTGLTVDSALFPFLHPGGRGAFKSGHSLSRLLQQRVQQLFSPYTLVKEYLLVMFQVRGRMQPCMCCQCFAHRLSRGRSRRALPC